MAGNVALVVAFVALGALLVVSSALWNSSRQLFAAVAALHPEQAHLANWPFFGQYGPLPPAQMAYLQGRRFSELSDPALKTLGRRALSLVYAYAASFLVLLLSLLWWSVAKTI